MAIVSSSGLLDDGLVDSLDPEWVIDRARFRLRVPPSQEENPAIRVLENLFTLIDVSDLDLLASGLIAGGTRATDAGGYTVKGDAVVAWDAGSNETTLSRVALTRLMVRLLDEVVRSGGDGTDVKRLADLADSLRQPNRP